MRVNAPAKINLHLRVGPPTPDGFHPLVSWMVTVGLFDTLEFRLREAPGVALTCDDPSIPCDQTNLVWRGAAAVLREAELIERQAGVSAGVGGMSALLRKRIPIGAGLGGGSSDGAAAITAAASLLQLGWSAESLASLGAQLGSDLPFFFHAPSAICTGRGEHVRPTPRPRAGWAVLILPPIHMPTPAVYREFDELGLGDPANLHEVPPWSEWATLTAEELLPRLMNDLETPAFAIQPALADLRRAAQDLLVRTVRMSGSGSSLFTLYDEAASASAAADKIRSTLRTRALAVELCPGVA